MAALILERGDAEDFAPVVRVNMPTLYKRYRSKIVKVMDNYYFKELSPDVLQQEI